eukprot:SRR837773.14457.p2 GENE.SRR837773.14457~~SRR837773.14457.p2  ORF type:complete len:152 (-),score=71.30 SRR837773.14457:198-611(-)
MSEKVQEHIKDQDEDFDKFMCYCRKTGEELQQSVAAKTEKIPQLQSSVEESTSLVEQLRSDIKEHKASKAAAEAAIQEQKQLRAGERKKFEAAVAEAKANIQSIAQALQVLEKARGGDGQSFCRPERWPPSGTWSRS